MTDTHVVSALKEKRIQVANPTKFLECHLRQAVMNLRFIAATIFRFSECARETLACRQERGTRLYMSLSSARDFVA
jgi:hypothetical protein